MSVYEYIWRGLRYNNVEHLELKGSDFRDSEAMENSLKELIIID